MNGKPMVMLTALLALQLYSGGVQSQEAVQSLRGANPIEETSANPGAEALKQDRSPNPREYAQQPPLIPHSITGFRIDLESNKCLDCHGRGNTEKSGATGLSQTHYTNRDGVELGEVSSARYFCTQCHVTQRDVKPLVENDFRATDAPR
jgi:cytochrome c-type protein NapB